MGENGNFLHALSHEGSFRKGGVTRTTRTDPTASVANLLAELDALDAATANVPHDEVTLEAIAELEVDVLDQLEAAAELAMLLRHVEFDQVEQDLVAAVAHGESLAEFALASGQTGPAIRKRWQRVREKFARACHAF